MSRPVRNLRSFAYPDPRRIRPDRGSKDYIILEIQKERGSFFVIAFSMATLIIAIFASFSTLAPETGSIPYATQGWVLMVAFYFICLGFKTYCGRFTALFWVGLVWEILFFLYLIFFIGFEIFRFNILAGFSAISRSFTIILFALNCIIWFAFLRIIVVAAKVRAKFKELRQKHDIYEIPDFMTIGTKIGGNMQRTALNSSARNFQKTFNFKPVQKKQNVIREGV